MDRPLKYIEWTADKDELLMSVPISVRALIDGIENDEAQGGYKVALSPDRAEKYEKALSAIVQFLRAGQDRVPELSLKIAKDWMDLLSDFLANLTVSRSFPEKMRNDTCTELENRLMTEKAKQFILKLRQDERDAIFALVRGEIDHGVEQYPPTYELIELVREAKREAQILSEQQGYQDVAKLPGEAEIFTVLEYEIWERLEQLLNLPLGTANPLFKD